MTYKNSIEGKLYELEKDLQVAQLNNWEFDIAILRDEIRELERELED